MQYDDEYKNDYYQGGRYGYSEKYGYDKYGECAGSIGNDRSWPWQAMLRTVHSRVTQAAALVMMMKMMPLFWKACKHPTPR